MTRLRGMLECLAQAVWDVQPTLHNKGASFGDALASIARLFHEQLAKQFKTTDIQDCLRMLLTIPSETLLLTAEDAIHSLTGSISENQRRYLIRYLQQFSVSVRQRMRRPGDIVGSTIPEELCFTSVEDWLGFLPDRMTRFQAGEFPANLDSWEVKELCGTGLFSEVWKGFDSTNSDYPYTCLKFITDPKIQQDFQTFQSLFMRILDQEFMMGIVPLRSVYMLTDPPCLEYEFLPGHDLTALILDWSWRDSTAKPNQILLIVRRIARLVGRLHRMNPPIVHRGLKPSNILFTPGAGGKMVLWISDLGWGEIASRYVLQLPSAVWNQRESQRGAYSRMYMSPQQQQGQPATPRDDVYAIGMIWYQMLQRNPQAQAPQNYEWAMELRKYGLTDSQARILVNCLDPNPDHRPTDGIHLGEMLEANLGPTTGEGSRTFQLKGTSTTFKALTLPETPPPTALPESLQVPEPTRKASMPRQIRNLLAMEFLYIPAGIFQMGSAATERGHKQWESPVHPVRISQPFYMSLFPVTQQQFLQVMGRNPSHHTKHSGGGPDHPVENVTWFEAVEFCDRLTEMPLETQACRVYRLPTEAEWEYACRAGTTTPFSFGDSVSLKEVHYFGIDAASWKKEARQPGKPIKVGSLPANPWGLHEMHGNVLEWCSDWFEEDYYQESPEEDPTGPEEGRQKVARGGSFSQFASDCRSAARLGRLPESRLNSLGFRVVLIVS